MKLVLAIPTYWTSPGGWRPGEAIYDHPTPLGQPGTLARTLQSLKVLQEREFELVVIAAATSPALAPRVEDRVAELVAREHPGAFFVGTVQRNEVSRGCRSDLTQLLGLEGYGNIRNMGLLAAAVLEADALVFIDDDEVIEDPHFVEKVCDGLVRGADGLAGYYVDSGGQFLLGDDQTEWEARWGKRRAMNQAFATIIGSPPRFKRTPFVFGGNMVISQRLLRSVCFDPRITRGEDIDYLINAEALGLSFFLDNTLAITHLPPPHGQPAWQQLRQDGIRLRYQRAKLVEAGLDPAAYDPYPGPLLRADLDQRLARAFEMLAEHYRSLGEPQAARQTLDAAKEVGRLSFEGAWAGYFALRQRWCELVASVGSGPPWSRLLRRL